MSKPRETSSGKGDFNRISNKEKFDEGYIKAFGKKCPDCEEGMTYANYHGIEYCYKCNTCNGLGKVDKFKRL